MNLSNLSSIYYFENNLMSYIYAFLVFILSFLVLILIKFVITQKIKNFTNKTKIKADDLIIDITKNIKWPMFVVISLYISLLFLKTPQIINNIVGYFAITIVAYYIVKIIQEVVDYITEKTIQDKKRGKNDKAIIDLISKIIKAIIWIIAFLIIIQNFGYDITALAAGLGIGGIAIAFALQNVLSDIFASLSIFFDKPFGVGDYISVDKDQGEVKKVGLKSTRIRTLEGDTLIIPNKELSEARIHNYFKMNKRRVSYKIGVTYETKQSILKKIPKLIEEIIKNVPETEFERVHFKKFGDSALIFNVVYKVLSRNYLLYLDINQKINYKIRETFEKEGIKMAYPTQTIHIRK